MTRKGLLFGSLAAALLVAPGLAGTKDDPAPSAVWGQGADAEAERFLLDAEIVESRDLGSGITNPKKVTLRLGDRTAFALWKGVEEEYAHPPTGSRRRDDMYFSDRWQHEIAAYRLDRLIGLGHVPVTVMRRLDGRPGALQQWIDGTFSERDRVERKLRLSDPQGYARSVPKLRVFDALIYNVDRTQENILIAEPGSRLWLIDHSRAFRLRRQLPPIDAGLAVPQSLLRGLRNLTPDQVEDALAGLLTRGQIRGILARRDRLLRLFGTTEASDR